MSRFIVSFVIILCDYFSALWHVYRISLRQKRFFFFLTANVIVFCCCYTLCDKLLPLDIVMDFTSNRFASSSMKGFGLPFMDSLVLLNVQQQKRQSLAALCRLTATIKWTQWSGFTVLSQLEVGDS